MGPIDVMTLGSAHQNHRVVNNWNELDEEVVMAGTVQTFKEKFDKRYRDGTP
ncbi:hypothetical protein E2C01_060381 [Portunus trituberculatus]|uniref:Uncharacterized protein n=1 Tax=Portunus trituberculatus TaxID=210409 RepID=A0A5B7H7W0_PORTR|nr:hypothetical protein [Portunus trituberculatus]